MTKAEIQFVRSLADKRVRDAEHLFVAEGDKLISEILSSGLRVRNIYALCRARYGQGDGAYFAAQNGFNLACCCGAATS